MENKLATTNNYSIEQIDLIKKTIAPKGITNDELSLFIAQCKRTQLDPFSRQIYATKIQDKISIQATIDGFRLIAERSGNYQGQTLPEFLTKEGKWVEVWTAVGNPIACKVGVYKKGFTQPLYAIAKWTSYAKDGNAGYMWKKMPEVMIAKVAEALALRKAFPNDLSGIYSSEEMDQVGSDTPVSNSQAPKVITPEKTISEMTIEELKSNYPKAYTLVMGVRDQKSPMSLLKFIAKLENSKLYTEEEKSRPYQEAKAKIIDLTPDQATFTSLMNDGDIFSLPTEGIVEEIFSIINKKYGSKAENGGDQEEVTETV